MPLSLSARSLLRDKQMQTTLISAYSNSISIVSGSKIFSLPMQPLRDGLFGAQTHRVWRESFRRADERISVGAAFPGRAFGGKQRACAAGGLRPEHCGKRYPVSFMAAPVFSNGKVIAVIFFEMSVRHLNDVMTSNKNWRAEGLGETGETYIVGEELHNAKRFPILHPGTAALFRSLVRAPPRPGPGRYHSAPRDIHFSCNRPVPRPRWTRSTETPIPASFATIAALKSSALTLHFTSPTCDG